MNISRKNRKQRSRNLKKVAKRLAAYSAAAAATVMTTQNRMANAAEIIWDIPDVTTDASEKGLKFQMLTGETTPGFFNSLADQNIFSDFAEGNFRLHPDDGGRLYGPAYSYSATPTLGFVGSLQYSGTSNTYSLAYISPLAGGSSSVSAGDVFVLGSSFFLNRFGYLNWSDGQTAFVGMRFALNGGADTHYGWAQITREDSTHFTIYGFGYNDTPGAASHPTALKGLDPVFGDLNGDFLIDAADWVILRDAYNVNAAGDLDENSVTDIDDFGLFRDAFELANPAAGAFEAMVAAAAVPEPSSIWLLAAGAAGLAGWRRRRSG